MGIPFVGLIYVIPFTLMLVILSAIVVYFRAKNKVAWGDGGIMSLQKAIRVQANFCEYMPWAFMLLLFFDMAGAGSEKWVHCLGGFLLFARIVHAIGLFSKEGGAIYIFGRLIGTVGTWTVMLISAFKLCASVHG